MNGAVVLERVPQRVFRDGSGDVAHVHGRVALRRLFGDGAVVLGLRVALPATVPTPAAVTPSPVRGLARRPVDADGSAADHGAVQRVLRLLRFLQQPTTQYIAFPRSVNHITC